jgi:hypothetical protein
MNISSKQKKKIKKKAKAKNMKDSMRGKRDLRHSYTIIERLNESKML